MEIIAKLERSMLTSWPAFSLAFDGDWVIRLADGHTKRSNSVTCLGADDTDLEARIDQTVSIYREHRLPTTFRLSPLAPPALDASLEKRGWRRFDETIVMTADLSKVVLDTDVLADKSTRFTVTTTPDPAWIEACRRIDGMGRANVERLERLLDNMLPPAGFGRIVRDDRIDALALAVLDNDLIGLFEVMTAADQRRRGLARILTTGLLRWGRQNGASLGWLAVVADNQPAVRLYQSQGFREVYRYHYRAET